MLACYRINTNWNDVSLQENFFLLLKIVCVLPPPPLPELINDRVLLKDFLKINVHVYVFQR